jgi:hypothetical protein
MIFPLHSHYGNVEKTSYTGHTQYDLSCVPTERDKGSMCCGGGEVEMNMGDRIEYFYLGRNLKKLHFFGCVHNILAPSHLGGRL